MNLSFFSVEMMHCFLTLVNVGVHDKLFRTKASPHPTLIEVKGVCLSLSFPDPISHSDPNTGRFHRHRSFQPQIL